MESTARLSVVHLGNLQGVATHSETQGLTTRHKTGWWVRRRTQVSVSRPHLKANFSCCKPNSILLHAPASTVHSGDCSCTTNSHQQHPQMQCPAPAAAAAAAASRGLLGRMHSSTAPSSCPLGTPKRPLLLPCPRHHPSGHTAQESASAGVQQNRRQTSTKGFRIRGG
jgi:hypothetical protein